MTQNPFSYTHFLYSFSFEQTNNSRSSSPRLEKRLKCQNGGSNCPQLDSLCSYSYCDINNNCATGIDQECLKQLNPTPTPDDGIPCKKDASNCPVTESLCSYAYCNKHHRCAIGINPGCLKTHENRLAKRKPYGCPFNCPYTNVLCGYVYCDENKKCRQGIDEECLKEHEN